MKKAILIFRLGDFVRRVVIDHEEGGLTFERIEEEKKAVEIPFPVFAGFELELDNLIRLDG